MRYRKKPIKIFNREPSNVYCPKCQYWLARVNAIKIEEGYICKECYRNEKEM